MPISNEPVKERDGSVEIPWPPRPGRRGPSGFLQGAYPVQGLSSGLGRPAALRTRWYRRLQLIWYSWVGDQSLLSQLYFFSRLLSSIKMVANCNGGLSATTAGPARCSHRRNWRINPFARQCSAAHRANSISMPGPERQVPASAAIAPHAPSVAANSGNSTAAEAVARTHIPAEEVARA